MNVCHCALICHALHVQYKKKQYLIKNSKFISVASQKETIDISITLCLNEIQQGMGKIPLTGYGFEFVAALFIIFFLYQQKCLSTYTACNNLPVWDINRASLCNACNSPLLLVGRLFLIIDRF